MSDLRRREFEEALERERGAVEARCRELVAGLTRGSELIREAIEYTLLGGGKRLRPILCLWTHDALGGAAREACLDVASAIECLHTYTLVHDDLPCMDDDDMRRGKPSCHRKFGEGIAVLTGDALLTLCFEILGSLGERRQTPAGTIVDVTRVISGAAGTGGLITGQTLDLTAHRNGGTLEAVENIHLHKTAALIAASMEAGAVMAGAAADDRDRMRRAGLLAGRAFQIVDDILDLEMDLETLGKTPGKDAAGEKLTYPSVAGVEGARERAAELAAKAASELGREGEGGRLGLLLDSLVRRRS